jgi:hypothetical protein
VEEDVMQDGENRRGESSTIRRKKEKSQKGKKGKTICRKYTN